MNRSDWQKAVDESVYEEAKTRAAQMARNEVVEPPKTAEDQFEASVKELQDAHARMNEVINKLFPIT
jgi:hypothetical protein